MSGGSTTSRRVFKALSIFGSVQIVTLLCSVVRTKCIALWLGTAGIGIFGLYNAAIEVINQLSQLNLRQSGVKEISGATRPRADYISAVVRRLGALLGLIGAVVTLLLAPLLSRITFGDSSHTLPFMLLSVVVFFNALTSGEQAILQANCMFRRLARASLWGGVVATAISIVLIRFFGFNAIVPSIIIFSAVIALSYFIKGSRVTASRIPAGEFLAASTPILRLGVYMTAATFMTLLAQYAFLAWMRGKVGDGGVGLYQSGYTIINQYVSLVFTAMAVEFFPRVSSVAASRVRTSLFVRHEMSMLLWGLLGAIVLFINLVPFIIRLLYDSTFLPVAGYVTIASVGTVLKAVSFVMAFVILARGDGKIYLITESLSAVLYLCFNMIGYRMYGLQGIGFAYVAWYAAYVVSVMSVYKFRYRLGGIRRPLLFSIAVFIVVAAQAALCLCGLYLAATIVSCIVVPFSGTMFYFLFLKRRTLKE